MIDWLITPIIITTTPVDIAAAVLVYMLIDVAFNLLRRVLTPVCRAIWWDIRA